MTAARTLPDVNSETYPYELVQSLLDQTANFSLFAAPEPGYAQKTTLSSADPNDFFGLNGGYGLAIGCNLHRFDATLRLAGGRRGLAVQQAVGEPEGRLRCRWSWRRDSTVSTDPSGSSRSSVASRFRSTASTRSGRSNTSAMASSDGFDTYAA